MRPSRGFFDRVPPRAWDHIETIGLSGFATLAALAHHCDLKDSCYPGVPRLAKMLHQSERTVQRNLAKLKSSGLVHITPRAGTSSLYRILFTPDAHVAPQPPTPVSPTPDASVATPPTRMSPKPDPITRSNNQEESLGTKFKEIDRAMEKAGSAR